MKAFSLTICLHSNKIKSSVKDLFFLLLCPCSFDSWWYYYVIQNWFLPPFHRMPENFINSWAAEKPPKNSWNWWNQKSFSRNFCFCIAHFLWKKIILKKIREIYFILFPEFLFWPAVPFILFVLFFHFPFVKEVFFSFISRK